jgi:hypothetical protein
MPDHGADLGVDLYKLDVVAKNDLPSVAGVYTDATAKFKSIANSLDATMKRPDYFGDTLGPVHTAWVTLHDAAGSVLDRTGSSLDDTAKVLSDAVGRYADTDQAAAKTFNDMLKTDGQPHVGG